MGECICLVNKCANLLSKFASKNSDVVGVSIGIVTGVKNILTPASKFAFREKGRNSPITTCNVKYIFCHFADKNFNSSIFSDIVLTTIFIFPEFSNHRSWMSFNISWSSSILGSPTNLRVLKFYQSGWNPNFPFDFSPIGVVGVIYEQIDGS